MKKIVFYAIAASFMLSACDMTEDPITPSGNYSVLRMTFPQGDNAWDEEIKQIHDTYGVYLLYKDITAADLNRKWTGIGTGKLYYGDDVPSDEITYYVDFFKDNVFPYVSTEMIRSTFPVKIYMLKNLKAVDPDLTGGGGTGGDTGGTGGTGTGGTGTGTGGTGTGTGTGTGGTWDGTGTGGTGTGTGGTGTGTGGTWDGTGTGGTGTGTGTGGTGTGTGGTGTGTGTGTGGTGTDGTGGTGGTGTGGTGVTVTTKFDGFDYWAISFSDAKNLNAESLKRSRYSFINQILTNLKKDGTIVDPEGWRDGIDFTTRLNRSNPNNPNYVYNRGFISWINDDMVDEGVWSISLSYFKNPNYNSGGYYADYFLSYVRAAMVHTRDEFYAMYPKDKFPLVAQKFEQAISYMKTKYGIDLQGIAEGPKK